MAYLFARDKPRIDVRLVKADKKTVGEGEKCTVASSKKRFHFQTLAFDGHHCQGAFPLGHHIRTEPMTDW